MFFFQGHNPISKCLSCTYNSVSVCVGKITFTVIRAQKPENKDRHKVILFNLFLHLDFETKSAQPFHFGFAEGTRVVVYRTVGDRVSHDVWHPELLQNSCRSVEVWVWLCLLMSKTNLFHNLPFPISFNANSIVPF